MSKRDYYEVLGIGRDADENRDQERLPQAGAPVSPGREQGAGRRRTLQGSQRSL